MELEENPINLIGQIQADDFYSQFLKNTNILNKSLAFTEQVKKLGDGIELLNQELQKQVLENHNDLLRQANHATQLENVLNIMNMHIQNLFSNAERLRTQITVPCEQLESHTRVLGRLHRASHILRQVSRVQQLSKRLSITSDPVQKATILQELEQLAVDPELVDIDVITSELRNIRIQQQKVVKLATGSLNQGINNENSIQTSTALQIFINLGTIKATVDNFVQQSIDECHQIVKMAFETNPSALSKSKGTPGRIQLTSSQGFRTKIWVELDKAFTEDLYHICKQIKFLQLTLNEFHIQSIDKNLAPDFWSKLGETVQDEIKQSSTAVQQMLEEDYPKLLKNYFEMTRKLNYDQFQFDRSVLKSLENSYLSSCLTRILDPIQSMFANETAVAPSQDIIDSLIRNMTSELSMALVEKQLSEQVAKNVGKCVKMFAVKTEQQLETGPEAAQVIGGAPNSGQQKNVHYANALYYLQTQVHRMLSNMKDSLPETSANIILESLQSLTNLTEAIIHPLIESINGVVETIMVTMHLEPDWTKLPLVTNKSIPSSPYMKELAQFVTRVYNTYLVSFQNNQVLSEKCSCIALRCIDLLVRHSSILRPLGAGGRNRLQSDFQHMEEALKTICPQLVNLGRPYRLLKSMASLITQTPEEIVAGHGQGSSVPHSTILLMLFAFAGPDLASPHQNTGWSLPKISAWLDEHPSEVERLDLVAGALQKYENTVRLKNSTNYDPVYPIMSQFLEAAVKEFQK